MKKYKVNVNGTDYEIKLEVLEDDGKVSAPAAKPAAKPAAAPKKAAGAGEQVNSPMPGTILSVSVKEGEAVKEGQVLMILEAMKMENEIVAPAAGTVTGINVAKGAAVESGTLLCTIG